MVLLIYIHIYIYVYITTGPHNDHSYLHLALHWEQNRSLPIGITAFSLKAPPGQVCSSLAQRCSRSVTLLSTRRSIGGARHRVSWGMHLRRVCHHFTSPMASCEYGLRGTLLCVAAHGLPGELVWVSWPLACVDDYALGKYQSVPSIVSYTVKQLDPMYPLCVMCKGYWKRVMALVSGMWIRLQLWERSRHGPLSCVDVFRFFIEAFVCSS